MEDKNTKMNSKKSLIASGLVSLALLAGVALVMAKDSSQRKIVVFDPLVQSQ